MNEPTKQCPIPVIGRTGWQDSYGNRIYTLVSERAVSSPAGRDGWLEHEAEAIVAACENAADITALRARVAELEGELHKAKRSLEGSGFTDCGGELWKPPLGKRPPFGELDALRQQLAEAERHHDSRQMDLIRLSRERDTALADNAKLRGLLGESNAALADRIISIRHLHESLRGTSAFNKYSLSDLRDVCEKLNSAEWLKIHCENRNGTITAALATTACMKGEEIK